ncbi:MAG: hypothetical protein KY457_05415 [Actinobacteria bacterium]|nr:hypothetical protein [Actinomycetota bacterium]
METGERLAAYLAGELDVDATHALEAELARDERLRARLDAIRATDEALAGLPPIEPPADFSVRLRDAVAAELDRQLPADGDELTARRSRRARGGTAATRTWWPQVAVAAAVLAVAGIGLSQLGQGDASGPEAALDTATDAMPEMSIQAASGPTVVAAGRSFDAENLRDLADDTRFDELVDQGLAGTEAERAADDFGAAIQGEAPADGGAMAAAEDARGTEAAMEAAPAPDIGLRTVGDVSEEDLEAVRECLPSLLEAQTAVIPVYVELVTFEGQDAIVYGLVGNDPAAETYSRVELWVVGRGDCQVVHFTQVDR